jgi:GTPase SAR1 family protein
MIMGKTFRVVVIGTKECGKTSIIEKVVYNKDGVSCQLLRVPFFQICIAIEQGS